MQSLDGKPNRAPDSGRAVGRLVAAWLVMLVIAVLNGAAREMGYGRGLDPLLAQQLSTLYGMTMLGVVMGIYAWRWPFSTTESALRAGILWLTLTVAFEFLFFHYVAGHSWAELAANYDLAAGRLWPLLLAWITVAPALFRYLWKQLQR